jgi:redox-sensitive bicupin YhaK (pirin superfamily)
VFLRYYHHLVELAHSTLHGGRTTGVVYRHTAVGLGSLEVLLIAGVPLSRPVARQGPFVMNTEGEIRQAI